MTLSGKTIFVSGGRGLLGSAVAARLLEVAPDANIQTIASEDHDLTDPAEAKFLVDRLEPDLVIHCAGRVGGIQANERNPYTLARDNLRMGLNVIDACTSAEKRPKLLVVGTTCFVAGTLIKMADGSYRPIEAVQVDDLVETASGLSGRVSRIMRRWHNGPMIAVRPKGAEPILATPEHPFLTQYGWVAAENLVGADMLVRAIHQRNHCEDVQIIADDDLELFRDFADCRANGCENSVARLPRDSRFYMQRAKRRKWADGSSGPMHLRKLQTERATLCGGLAWLCGAYVAEGFINRPSGGDYKASHSVHFTPGYDDAFCQRIADSFSAVWGSRPKIYKDRTSYRCVIGCKPASDFFKQFYCSDKRRRADTKMIPGFLMNGSLEVQAEFLRGYWKGDGHVRERQADGRKGYAVTLVATSTSRILMLQIRDMLLRLGVFGSVYYRKPTHDVIEGRKVHVRPSWTVRVEGRSAIEMLRILNGGTPSPRQANKRFVAIKSLRQTESMEIEVFNLSVDGEETYQAEGVAVHNCSYSDLEPPFTEDKLHCGLPEYSNRGYGIAKRTLHTMLEAALKEKLLPGGCFIVPANLYGPGDHFDEGTSHVIPALIKRFSEAGDAQSVTCWGSGYATRDFLHVRDCAEGVVAMCEKCPPKEGGAFGWNSPESAWITANPVNLGTGREISIHHLAEMIARLCGYRGRIEWDRDRPDGQKRRALDSTRAHEWLGWRPRVLLEDGLREVVEWWKSNKNQEVASGAT